MLRNGDSRRMKMGRRLFLKVCWRQRNKEVQTVYRGRSCPA